MFKINQLIRVFEELKKHKFSDKEIEEINRYLLPFNIGFWAFFIYMTLFNRDLIPVFLGEDVQIQILHGLVALLVVLLYIKRR